MKEVNRIKIPGPPGTGKTHRLIHHYLNKEINEYKTPQFKILYVGFSNAAVDEAKERINKLYEYIKLSPLVIYIVKGVGFIEDLDFEIMIKDNNELFEFIKDLKIKFPELVGEYKTIVLRETKKVKYLPF